MGTLTSKTRDCYYYTQPKDDNGSDGLVYNIVSSRAVESVYCINYHYNVAKTLYCMSNSDTRSENVNDTGTLVRVHSSVFNLEHIAQLRSICNHGMRESSRPSRGWRIGASVGSPGSKNTL